MTFPNETLPRGRRQKTTAFYDRLVEKGAQMDQTFGLEHAMWFADGPQDAHEAPSFKRNRSYAYVGREVAAVRSAVGGIEITIFFAKHNISGPGARAYLDHILAGYVPKPGRVALNPMLTPKGKLYGDLSVACLDETSSYYWGRARCKTPIASGLKPTFPRMGNMPMSVMTGTGLRCQD